MGSTGERVLALERVVGAQRNSCASGVATSFDLLVAERLRAQLDQSKARYDFIRKLTVFHIRAGTLTRAEVEAIDRHLRATRSA